MPVPEFIVTAENMLVVSATNSLTGEPATHSRAVDQLDSELIDYFQMLTLNAQDYSTISSDEIRLLGRLLYRILFPGSIDELFRNAYNNLPEKQRLRVQLTFRPEASLLAKWPWEYLYFQRKDSSFFFASDNKLVLSRYSPLGGRTKSLQVDERPLKVLIVISQPKDLKEVDPAEAIAAIHKLSLLNIPIEIKPLTAPRVDTLTAELEDFHPHIVHFIGHGGFDHKSGKGVIALHNEADNAFLLPDQDLKDYFGYLDTKPRLVFLHMCEGASSDYGFNASGVSQHLIEANIPAVVAMQHPITSMAAIAFSREFYETIAKGEPVEYAVQKGRKKITQQPLWFRHPRVMGTPVLHLQSLESIIIPGRVDADHFAAQSSVASSSRPETELTPQPERSHGTLGSRIQPPSSVQFKGIEEAAKKTANLLGKSYPW